MSDSAIPDTDEQARIGRRVILTLTAANFFLFFGAGAQQQYLVTYVEKLGEWQGVAGASLIAGIYLSMLVFRLANVWLLRRWPDRMQTIVGSLTYTAFCAAMALFFVWPSYALAIGAALVWGWGGAALWAGSSLQILAATDAGRRQYGTGIGILYTATHLGFWLGVVGLGELYERLPEASLYILYIVAAGVTVVGNIVLLTTPRLRHVSPEEPSLAGLLSVLSKAKARIAGFLQFTSAMTFGLMLGSFGALIQAEYGEGLIWVLAHWYPAARLTWSLASGALSDRIGNTAVLAGSFFLATASLVACALWFSPVAIAAAAAAFGLLSAAVPVIASAIVGDSADRRRRPLAYGSLFAFRDAGVVIAALAGQFLVGQFGGIQSLFLIFAVVFGLCGVVAVSLQRWAQQRL